MTSQLRDAQELAAEVARVKHSNPLDLSSDQDLVVALMNLISIEEHLFFTGAKTEKPHYYDLLNEVRNLRKTLLKEIVVDYEGEVWCISKHLLAASMRLMEVGAKQLSLGHRAEASSLFDKAYSMYALFWGLNTRGEETADGGPAVPTTSLADDSSASAPGEEAAVPPARKRFGAKLREYVSKFINCCIE